MNGAPLFARALLAPEEPVPACLTSAASGNDEKRFAVYRNNVTVALVRAMESNFPSVVRLLGQDYFAGLARLFVQNHPPKTRLLFEYGEAFCGFLDSFEPLSSYPYLGDVARIEQAWREAFHETDCVPLESGKLSGIPAESVAQLRFHPHPAARVIASRFAAGTIFVANRQPDFQGTFDPARPEWVLVTRPHLDCALRILTPSEGQFTCKILAGESLGKAASLAAESDTAFDLSAAISGLLGSGALAGFNFGDNHSGGTT